MNKNLLKMTFLSVGALLLISSSLFVPLASAAIDPGAQTSGGAYLDIPLVFTRDKPTTKASPGNCVGSTDSTNDPCVDIASGIGMYNYVSPTPTPTNTNIGGSNITIEVNDATDNTQNFTKSFTVTSNGHLRIYGLTLGHSYMFNFFYVDSASPDIKKIIGNMPKYCEGNAASFANLDQKSPEWNISRNLVSGCNRYDKEPFLPANVDVYVPSATGSILYKSNGQVAKAFSIKAVAPTGSVAAATPAKNTDDCPAMPSDPLRFLACPFVTNTREAVQKFDSIIQNFLFVPTDQIFTPEMQKAWNTFRILGVALILIAGLVMVISQAAGMELFDAYTVRKVLPRLLVAAIGMALSWPLMQFVVTFFNDLGVWSHDLILAPFGDLANQATAEIVLLPLFAIGAGGVFAAVSLGIAGTLSLLFTLLAAAIIGLLVLAVRQLVIMVAVIMAPLAIAAYVLPGTQKLWKFWKDAFLTSLIMFPIIMAFIAAGKALAIVAAGSNSTEMHILSVLVYFAPYFLLPFAFKLAGGLMATVFSIANDRSRGIFDRGKKKRAELGQQRRARAGSNALWDPKYRKMNTLASWSVDPVGNTAYAGRNRIPGLKKSGQRIAGQIEHARVEQSGKLFEELNKAGYNDKAYRALSGVHEGFEASTSAALEREGLLHTTPRSLADVQKLGKILSESDSATERIAGNAITGSAGRLATLYQDPEMMKADIGAAGIMGLASHGFASGDDLAAAGNRLMGGKINPATGKYEGMHASEAGYAQSIVSQAQLMGMRSRPDVKPGYGVLFDSSSNTFIDGMTEGKRDLDLISTLSSHDVAGAKGGFLKNMRDSYGDILLDSTPQDQALAAQFRKVSKAEEKQLETQDPEQFKQYKLQERAARTIQVSKNAETFKGMDKAAQDSLKANNRAQYDELARAAKAKDLRQATVDQLFSWAGPYSQASVDVKAQSLQMIQDFGMQGDFDRYRRTETDPTRRGEGGGGDE